MKYKKQLYDNFKKSKVFSLRDVRILFNNKNISKDYSKNLMSNLIKEKKIHKITNGKYTFQEEIMCIGFAFSPFYYGLQEALSLHNLHEQETNAIIITTNKIKPGIREIMDTNVYLRRIDKKYFFGYDFIKYYDIEIPVSDIEKTLIDLVYYKESISKDVILEIKKKIDLIKLNEYLEKYPITIKNKVLDLIK
jgi:predicted transcriptional regulator of viral defense system